MGKEPGVAPNILELILSERQIAYAITNRDFVIQAVHGDANLLWGDALPPGASALGQKLSELVPELAASEEELHAVADGQISHLRYQWVNRPVDLDDEVQRYVSLSVQPYAPEDGSSQQGGLLYLVQDVTEQGRLQQELMQRHNELRLLKEQLERRNNELAAANAELQLMNEMRAAFVSLTAHELRTPLTSIYGYLELLLDEALGPLTEEQQESLQMMQAGAEHLLTTVTNLVDVVRLNSDRIELVLQPVDARALVQDALEPFEPQAQAKGQQVRVHFADDLPLVLCDPLRAKQIIGHLLSTAIRQTPSNAVVTVRVDADPARTFLQVSVQEGGPGRNPALQAQFLEHFSRPVEYGRSNGGDAGLGLYLTRALVDLHGGQAWYEAGQGQGGVFHITLPALEATTLEAD